MNTQNPTLPKLPENLWSHEESLCHAAEMIDRMGSRLRAVSFDFFDTIVWRLVARPADVFHEAGLRLEQQDALRQGVTGSDYQTLRFMAEIKARGKQNAKDPSREDITIGEIYEQLKQVTGDVESATRAEHALETEVCLINPGMAEFIQYAKQRDLRLVVVSDIYFSADQLQDILRTNHFDTSVFEFVLTSADAGVCKGTGNLFRLALKKLGLESGQLLHIGDNYHADVAGARKAGVQACHYPGATPEAGVILDRERVLLAGCAPIFNANSLRLLAARYFPEETPEAFFAREGAMVMGPILSRFAAWACLQYVRQGIRKVGAFMREGELLSQTMQREAHAKGYDLEIKPLFVNRKATALAAIGRLTADGLIHWLLPRVTLPMQRVLKDLGLSIEDIRRVPLDVDKPANDQATILKLAKHLFQPDLVQKIDAASAAERRKVMDYLRPWIQKNNCLGVCDLGYSASAQMQLARIFELEVSHTKMTGCYLVTNEAAAERALGGMDVRSFLASFAKPNFYFRTFIRSPAVLEQMMVAPCGTTLGYERQPDGSVLPITDKVPYDKDMMRRQQAFRDGVLLYQSLWLRFRSDKPALLDGQSEFSRRVLADLDTNLQPILTRLTAFPTQSEVAHFGSLPLDDAYFHDAYKLMCAPSDRAMLRQHGYAHTTQYAHATGQVVHWPQGTYAQENPAASSNFFSYAKALLLCGLDGDNDGVRAALTVFVAARRSPTQLVECLRRLAALSDPKLVVETVVCVPKGAEELMAAAREFARQQPRTKLREIERDAAASACMNEVADNSVAPLLLFLDEDVLLPAGWDHPLRAALASQPDVAVALPQFPPGTGHGARCLLLARRYFTAALGFKEELSPEAASLNLLLRLRELGLKIVRCAGVVVELNTSAPSCLEPKDTSFLRKRWPNFEKVLANVPQSENPAQPDAPQATPTSAPRVSIIIPTFNRLDLTRRCLQSVYAHTPAPAHEVIVVDNGSTDGTADFLRGEEAAGRLRVILNPDNASFAKSCNQGAKVARAQYVVFLNNDTEVQTNWLGALFSLAEADPSIAAVGSKLLLPDGTIQHAGIALADCWDHDPLLSFHIFAREKSEHPMANQRRVYQAVTGACMLARKSHFDEVGGFDEQYWNGCEDVDLCLRFQQRGWLSVYEPGSVAIHHASQSDLDSPNHAPQNVERFHQKWLENASPDVIIEQDGKNRMTPTSVMRLYAPPSGKLVSIIILAHNQLRDTQLCLASIEKHTPLSHELILVDNGSTDGTTLFFRNYAAKHGHVRVILNRANLGFSAGNNQGLACARGDSIVLLNNDTVLTPGWLERMLTHLDLYPECGLVGPVSNSVSGPQLVSTANYSNLDRLPKFSNQWCASHAGQSTPVPRLVGFCLLFRRAVLEKIGGLDPQFGSGNFEDDDFCIRAGLAGFTLRIALDSFVHHTGGQTFKGAKIDYRASMEKNWALFKAKWSMPQDAPLDKGYRLPSAAPNGLALRLTLPRLEDSHTSSLEGRCLSDKTLPDTGPKKSSRQPAVIALPRCALTGHLGEARELVRRRQWPAAWTAVLSAIFARPFHPEAYLLLAEIAQAAGDAGSARRCAQAARDMAPSWAPPKQFLKGNPRGAAKPEWLKLPPALSEKPAAPTISVCLIARNEERFLAQCLRSVRSLASQIVVVDTGSTDRTIEIAREFEAEVHDFAWCDDFSAARNAALEYATGDWVLILDADEELMPSHVESLAREIRSAAAMGYRLPIVDRGREEGGCSYVPRLFRNAPGLFFVGRIHEQAFSSIQVRCHQWGLKHLMGETTLLHHGYTPELVASRNKVERNLRLLERAIEELPGEPNLIMSLGLELVHFGKLDAGLDRYWEAFRLMSAMPADEVTPELKETLLTQLGTHLMAAKKFSDIVKLWQIPFAQSGGMTASEHFCLGVAYMELKQPSEAAEQMRQCIAKRDRPALSPINPEIHKAGPHHCLAMCLIALNDIQGAQQAFDGAVAADASSRTVRFDLARFQAAQGRTGDALKIVRQLTAENPAEARVWELGGQIALSHSAHLAIARDWTAEAIQHFPEDLNIASQHAEALMLNQEPAPALSLWRKGPISPRQRAAITICELLTGDRQLHFTAAEEPAISQEVVKWYRQFIRMSAHGLINQWHGRMETIRLTLPTFARVLEAAHRQARQAAA